MFCSSQCEKDWDKQQAVRQKRLQETEAYVFAKWPFVKVVGASTPVEGTVQLSLSAPGLFYNADWRSDDPDHVTVFGEKDANRWKELTALT